MDVGFPQLAAIRLGYGLSPLMPPPRDAAEVLASVASSGPAPDAMNTAQAAQMDLRLRELRQSRKQGDEEKGDYKEYSQMIGRLAMRDAQKRLARAVDAPVGFGERLVQFWADHFTARPDGGGQFPLAIAFVDEAIRPHVNGRFEDLFAAADTHPMMLLFLNQNVSRGPTSVAAIRHPNKAFGLNENLAREAMELHSLGVGAPYTQKDVRELAELLTGLTYGPRTGFEYRPQFAEPGAETVLGKSYGGMRRGALEDIRAVFRDLARRPETAVFVSRKLAVHFVSDNPSPELVAAMARAWRKSDGHLPEVYRAMITHPELASSFRQKVRQPFDYVATAFRALGVTGAQIMALDFPQLPALVTEPLARMGQRWMRPVGPDGWAEEAATWIVPQLLAGRMTWAMQMPRKMLGELPDPRELLQVALAGTESEALAWAVPKAESQVEGVALVLASSDFNRR